MWVFLSDAFLSVIAHRDEPDLLIVRSRIAGDIERALPEASVFEDDRSDYRYRALVPRGTFSRAMAEAAASITATNFKASVTDKRRHDAYMDVWRTMARWFGAYGSSKA